MVKQDKADILDLFLGNGIDIGQFLSENGEAFSRPRFQMTGMEDYESQTEQEMSPNTVLTDSFYSNADFLSDVVPSVIEVTTDESPAIEDSVVTVEYCEESPPYCESSMEGFQNLEDSSSTQFPFDDVSLTENFFIEEANKSDLDIDLSPLLKEEIKFKIKARRMAEGKEDIRVEFKEPSPERLTEEEEEKRKVKREKNKLAAQKCRNKKRKLADMLQEETDKLEQKQEKLQEDIQRLREEKEQLLELIKIHRQVCPKMAKRGK